MMSLAQPKKMCVGGEESPTVWSRLVSPTPFHLYSVVGKDIEEGTPDTLAYSFLSVSIRPPLTPTETLAVLYSFVPYAITVLFFFWFALGGQFFPFYCLCQKLLLSVFAEAVLKRLFKQARPAKSAVRSYGMPSSHCLTSYCVMTWILLELSFGFAYHTLPRIVHAVAALSLLAPMPWARYHLEDHTRNQCIVGCTIGVLAGVGCFWLRFVVIPAGTPLL
ncbi:unnamed protein product [Vitrella brassicaformis CCMP3155]|uniref:Phosphatidic acid phosphatase type 2/haloperoxidase domain-containing protein n=2 Tax=Vitrella brassicaformis TaxID=1169539 RepID=A0A0G4GKM8_VITBC|nr:unnamed protein product [Vitrella brassicaformis CCMP3155]|mmetsp:Transcript_22685/g.55972  ORF Transcript_22685/g.55972 Transcript_22685/m.55972 type:complete len:220 (+) Transcript_22685:67-726(+)|eukprot:CEM30548.1 unnamed protein product [Vitrella brassicaformis CCMP3155]